MHSHSQEEERTVRDCVLATENACKISSKRIQTEDRLKTDREDLWRYKHFSAQKASKHRSDVLPRGDEM